ncbi:MAG: sensor histidine kinase [Hamadaea sp.]|uniref:sensor histidine kinase n=1 Tax=Hamadaea sp. TaxID=2024425 RepID=UPI0017D9960E|nr:sensor histidine kinase [Hamadaea sp.]NUR72369.1 sensor histidine kinase [Hamadaea sp.]NUT20270.1 sensor histidine kinase [Hamadaea sp.]
MRNPRSLAFDVLVSAGVACLATLPIFLRQTSPALTWLGLVMAVALLVRRHRPLWSMGVIAAMALAQVVFWSRAHDPLPYDLAVLIGMYSAVKYSKTLRGGLISGFVVAIGIVIEVARHADADSWWQMTLFYVGICGGVWLMAYTVRQRAIYVAGLEERAASLERERAHLARIAVADERAVIARELHDVVAHSLAVMVVQADGGRYALDADPEKSRQAMATVAETGRAALEDMRRLVGVLRGSADSPQSRRRITLAELDPLVAGARSAGLTVRVENTVGAVDSPALELAVYRIVQEGLTNVMRHAGPDAQVDLDLRRDGDEIVVHLTDNGRGGPCVDGHGLTGMRERVSVHGGSLHAGPRLAGGWEVRACLPLPEAVAA